MDSFQPGKHGYLLKISLMLLWIFVNDTTRSCLKVQGGFQEAALIHATPVVSCQKKCPHVVLASMILTLLLT